MTQPEFAAPPRKVRYQPRFARDKLLSILIPGAVALTIAGFGIRSWLSYNRLLHSGVAVDILIDGKWISSGKSNSYYVDYRIPADKTQGHFVDETDQMTYESLRPQSTLRVTYDPLNFKNHVLGAPSSGGLEARTLWFVFGVTLFALIGAGIRFLVTSTAKTEWTAMSDWNYDEPPVVSVKSAGNRSGSLIVTLDIANETPNRRAITTLSNAEEVHFGDHIPVLYDPQPGESGILRVSSIKYVELDGGT